MSLKEFFRKLQFVIMLTLGTYPVTACIIIFVTPALLPYMWLFAVAYGGLCLLSFALPGKLRLSLGIVGAALFVLPCVLLLESNARNIMVTFALGYGALLIWSVRIPGWDSDQEMPVGWLGACFVILLFGCLLSHYETRLSSVSMGIRISFFVFVFLAMLSLNRGSLQLAAGSRRGFSPAMRHKNLLLTMGMFGIAIAVALIPSVLNLFQLLFGWLGGLMEKIAGLFPDAPSESTVTEITETTEAFTIDGGLGEGLETHRTSQTTFFMMAVIALAFMVPVGGYALYKLVTTIWAGTKRLAEGIIAAAGNQAEDFQDEITDTREDAESAYYRGAENRKRFAPSVTKMTPAEQIRYRYRKLAEKHPEWKQHHTARENLSEDAAQLYERARYSEHPITKQQADTFKEKTK